MSTHTIAELGDALIILKRLAFSDEISVARSTQAKYQFPFGLWFRGQGSYDWPLVPGIFRQEKDYDYFNETRLFNNFRLRTPELAEDAATFDWLCLMQHYGLPTRILDWTESLLVALYFAVESRALFDADGALFVLNSPLLNSHSAAACDLPPNLTIHTPGDYECVARSELARTSRRSHYLRIRALDETSFHQPTTTSRERLLETMVTPIAVFPSRRNQRMALQSSVFTLHGGKAFSYGDGDTLPPPTQLESLNQSVDDRFLLKLLIPADSKKSIHRDIEFFGINQGVLFPELDAQTSYMRRQWAHPHGDA